MKFLREIFSMSLMILKKRTILLFKVFTPFWRHAEQFFLQRVPSSDRNVSKCENKISYFSQTINEQDILQKRLV